MLFNDTILYNIAYGGIRDNDIKNLLNEGDPDGILKEKVVQAAQKAQIHDFIMNKDK